VSPGIPPLPQDMRCEGFRTRLHFRAELEGSERLSFDRHAALGSSERAEFCLIVRVVLENLQALHNERRQQLDLFFFSHWTMNAGGEDHSHARG